MRAKRQVHNLRGEGGGGGQVKSVSAVSIQVFVMIMSYLHVVMRECLLFSFLLHLINDNF